MKNISLGAAIAALAISAAGTAAAQDSGGRIAVGPELGTAGVGVQVQVRLNDRVSLRGSGDWGRLSRNKTYSGVSYDGKLNVATGGAFIDYHPFANAFFVSGGAYFGKRRVDLLARPTGPVNIGGVDFTPAQIGVVTGQVKMSDTQPFLGLGYDSTFQGDSAWGVQALLGVSFSSAPSVNLLASGGTLSNDPATIARIKQEEIDDEHAVRNYKYYPIVQVSVTRRF